MPTLFTDADAGYMMRALALARRGEGRVEPNPMVGAVVVKGSRVVGTGVHRRFGGPHAEVFALQHAGRLARDATLYVTLEPCCHWGKTPPCTDSILAAGISRVVVAMIDPFAQVHGQGVALLRRKRVRVDVGLLQGRAVALNAPYLTRLGYKRPYVIAKWAQSLDGCVATSTGESRWISSDNSRGQVHALRGRVDGIIVGIGTALADDPLLTARPAAARDFRRLATRIVIDSTCRLPLKSRLVESISEAPLLIAHRKDLGGAAEKRRAALSARGAMTLPLSPDSAGRVQLVPLLQYLGKLDYTNVLVEGGPETMASFFNADLVDEAHIYIAPMIIGGPGAVHAVGGADLKKLAAATRLQFIRAAPSGPDMHLLLQRP